MMTKIGFIKWIKQYIVEISDHHYPETVINADLLKAINEFESYVRYSTQSEKAWEEHYNDTRF